MAGFLRFWVGGKCGTCPQCVSRSRAYKEGCLHLCGRERGYQRGTSFGSSGLEARSGTRSTAMPNGRQVQKKLGPAWTQRGRPPAGYFTKRLAEAWTAFSFGRCSGVGVHSGARCGRARPSPMPPAAEGYRRSRYVRGGRADDLVPGRRDGPTDACDGVPGRRYRSKSALPRLIDGSVSLRLN